ncbi:hypothetical protein BD311DRAFT_762796 [Dichomitus squalens]|uniref:Poly A polymerase head domain-containing protein n=2 Tax=Dichomitus squalens TaxID=114155 RepID=A0A4Q9MIA9_9APHY|nr:hypothetical protein BD311DRAFT_762796 [Dichomitus squalens]
MRFGHTVTRRLVLPFLRQVPRSRSFYWDRVSIPGKMTVQLTAEEDELCTLLDQCTHNMKEAEGIETTCRIAGGWVRDKLLGSECNDIDIALENMMGVSFAERFVDFCRTTRDLPVKNIAKIESNPDQSKHLETARTTILGIELDFVNLRSEEYAENSRIPTQVTFGTPLQDALRRDITINTLFYNVHTRLVEDHTGRGLDDLRSGTIRTPLSPKETFTDDPLRVLRCIRFASRFGFTIVPELQEAAKDLTIQEALRVKISRERVGEELDKMMGGRNPLLSIDLIDGLSLYASVFYVPENAGIKLSGPPSSSRSALQAAMILHVLTNPVATSMVLSGFTFPSLPPLCPLLLSEISTPAKPLRRLYLASALTPYRGLTYLQKGKERPAVEAVIREGLKLGAQYHYLDGIPALFSAADTLQRGVATWENGGLDRPERAWIGVLLRDKNVHSVVTGSMWASSLLFSLVQELTALWNPENTSIDEATASSRVHAYNKLAARVEELGLQAAVDAKPILDGKEVVKLLGATPGQWTGQVLARVVEWQLEHPEGTKQECEAWLRAEHEAGRISTASSTVKRGQDVGSDAKAKKAKR